MRRASNDEKAKYCFGKKKKIYYKYNSSCDSCCFGVIWVIPIAWIIMISFRGESGQYISTLIPKTFTLNNYKKLFTDYADFEFSADVY